MRLISYLARKRGNEMERPATDSGGHTQQAPQHAERRLAPAT